MQITTVKVTDYKKIRDITITPDADSFVVLIGGGNAQGKSSVFDALEAALAGKGAIIADPVRHGAEEAAITVEIDGGALRIHRSVQPDGTSRLEVRDAMGAIKSPQAMLDKLIGGRFIDPLQFLAEVPKAQRAKLLALIDTDGAVAALDIRRERIFDRRTEVARDHKKALARLEGEPRVTPQNPIDVSALAEQGNRIREHLAEHNARRARWAALQREVDIAAKATIEATDALTAARKRYELAVAAEAKAEEAVARAREILEAGIPADDAEEQRNAIDAKLRSAADHNRRCANDEATARRRAELEAEVKKHGDEQATLTEQINTIDIDKAHRLATAALPVPGLGVDDHGVTLNGIPLEQASGAEKHRVALALAIAAKPQLRDVWIRDGALFDDESLAAIVEIAERERVRIWLERVGTRDPGVIVIRDGQVIDRGPHG